ncbi:PDDEXK nuclease domain-containing protein [Stieleria varia]|nr:PDDEXK nuclease domain-containing protein [Stieleria varia]
MNDKTKKRAVVKKDTNSKSSPFNIHHSTFSYPELLGEIKARVRSGQQRAAMAAHAEMLTTYWDIGRMIAARQEAAGWGAGVLQKLATDLKNELPEEKGFSARNLKLMVQFFHTYPLLVLFGQRSVAPAQSMPEQTSIGQRAVAQLTNEPKTPSVALSQADVVVLSAVTKLSWAHNVILMQKIKHLPTRVWYARQTLQQGWSRDTLIQQIRQEAHLRQGTAITNFANTLPEAHASLAQGLLKDPYLFDFLTIEEPFHERELETGLLDHVQKFLLELGRGFAFVGRQYELTLSDQDYYLDLLFYHLHLRCFVVVDLKVGNFKPEYAGKMNFYCSVVDDVLRHPHDAPTIGLILCQTKNEVIAEYSLRDIQKPIGVADYELTRALPQNLASSLPSIDEIETEMNQLLKDEEGVGGIEP